MVIFVSKLGPSHYLNQHWIIINWTLATKIHWYLTHWGRVTEDMRQQIKRHWTRWCLVAWSALSHHLNQCWNIVYLTLSNALQWNDNRNSYIFIQEMQMHLKTSSAKCRPSCLDLNVLNHQALLHEFQTPFIAGVTLRPTLLTHHTPHTSRLSCCAVRSNILTSANLQPNFLQNEAMHLSSFSVGSMRISKLKIMMKIHYFKHT